MSLEAVKKYLSQYGLDGRVREYSVSSATVALAAAAIGCTPERIAKTLSFDVNGNTLLIVASGDAKIDNAKFKAAFQTKAKMLPFDCVEKRTGHAPGGVCPFAVKDGTEIYLDISLKRFHTVFPACGSANSVIELTPEELFRITKNAGWTDVCKLPDPPEAQPLF